MKLTAEMARRQVVPLKNLVDSEVEGILTTITSYIHDACENGQSHTGFCRYYCEMLPETSYFVIIALQDNGFGVQLVPENSGIFRITISW